MKEGLLELTRDALSILCCITQLPGSSKQPNTSHLDILIYIRSEELYIISHTLGTHNTMIVNGEWGVLKKFPISSEYNQLTDLQSDCFRYGILGLLQPNAVDHRLQNIKGHHGNIVNSHENRDCFSIMCVKLADAYNILMSHFMFLIERMILTTRNHRKKCQKKNRKTHRKLLLNQRENR